MALNNNLSELRQAAAAELIVSSKKLHSDYRKYTEIVKDIYDWAKAILDSVFSGQKYSLPIDVRTVAAQLGFTISVEDFSEVEKQYFNDGHESLPIAQLKMRQKLFGMDSDKICGTIHLANYLSENSIRFSIAHELGHFALREHNPIGSSLVLEACPGLYPMVESDEMLADLFAYALLLPYDLFEAERKEYENDRTHWPLDYTEWIEYIRDKAQMPEYYAVLACQEIKKYNISERRIFAEQILNERLHSLGISKEEQSVARELYAITINNLESWGFSREQVADILFGENKGGNEDSKEYVKENSAIIAIMHDLYMDIKSRKIFPDLKKEYPPELTKHIIRRLNKLADLSANGICEVTTLPLNNVKDVLACIDDINMQ
ncbi:MAG: ImmA/IrrE family metallo-endopeptidase [Lachnospiraceae bacterium]|nr:ImmA/IrrE family metallo-endopeptidase [Lachnospiraceae bacterium]